MASDPQRPSGARAAPRRHEQRGSVLMLMPAAVLVVLVLAALAVDRAVVFGAQRDLVATAQAAANDGASALDIDALRGEGRVGLDAQAVGAAIERSVALAPGDVVVQWTIQGDTVVVRLQRRVDLVFSPAVPGGPTDQLVTATASADLRRR